MSPGESCHVENRDLSTAHKVSLIWKIRKSQTDIAHDEEGTNHVIKVVLGGQGRITMQAFIILFQGLLNLHLHSLDQYQPSGNKELDCGQRLTWARAACH